MLIDNIRKDRITAFKAKENIKKDILGCLIADSCKEVKEPDDFKVFSIIKKFIENAKEVKYNVGPDCYEAYKADMEIKILSAYLPKQMDEEEVKLIIAACILTDTYGVGPIMKHFKETFNGQYDASMVSRLAKEMCKNG